MRYSLSNKIDVEESGAIEDSNQNLIKQMEEAAKCRYKKAISYFDKEWQTAQIVDASIFVQDGRKNVKIVCQLPNDEAEYVFTTNESLSSYYYCFVPLMYDLGFNVYKPDSNNKWKLANLMDSNRIEYLVSKYVDIILKNQENGQKFLEFLKHKKEPIKHYDYLLKI